MTLLYFISAIAILQGIVSLIQGVSAARHIRGYRPKTDWRPRVAVFCPCKGTDAEFGANVRSILDQEYPDIRIVFIVESAADPAFRALESLGAAVLVAGEASDRGQKVHNLIHGVEHGAGDAEVLVFCDADARFPRDWVQSLIAPLESSGVAVTTGYRWYAAESGRLPSLLRSAWNASAVMMLGDHGRNFAWGGSMAMRRAVFDAIGVRRAWEGAVSDDYAVTRSARAARKRIVFLPACLVPSYGDCSWSELLEFTTRQILITRVYDPAMWRMALFTQTVFNAAFWSWLAAWRFWPVPVALFLLAGIKSYLRYEAVRCVLPAGSLSKHRASYILLAPLTALLFEYNLIRSALTRNLTWRQIRYRLVSPERTVVRRGAAGN